MGKCRQYRQTNDYEAESEKALFSAVREGVAARKGEEVLCDSEISQRVWVEKRGMPCKFSTALPAPQIAEQSALFSVCSPTASHSQKSPNLFGTRRGSGRRPGRLFRKKRTGSLSFRG